MSGGHQPISWESATQTERINGNRTHLGSMSLEELIELEGHCRRRVEDAKVDLMIVTDVRERRFPELPLGDAAIQSFFEQEAGK